MITKRAALIGFLIGYILGPSAVLEAQTPTNYKLEVWTSGSNPDTGLPVKSIDFTPTQLVCNQAPIPVTPTTLNPTRFYIDDTANPTKVCLASLPSTYLDSLPNGTYFNTITYNTVEGLVAPRSAMSNPFIRQVLNALTGLKVVK